MEAPPSQTHGGLCDFDGVVVLSRKEKEPFSLIPSLFERYISIGCADLIWDIT